MENNIHKELSEIAPLLAAMDKENPFKVPNDYFNQLKASILSSTAKEKLLWVRGKPKAT